MLWPVKWTENVILPVCQLAIGSLRVIASSLVRVRVRSAEGAHEPIPLRPDCSLLSTSIFAKTEVFKCNENPRTGHIDQNLVHTRKTT
jgi:hypothetical protein